MDDTYWLVPAIAVAVLSLILAAVYMTRPPRLKPGYRDFSDAPEKHRERGRA